MPDSTIALVDDQSQLVAIVTIANEPRIGDVVMLKMENVIHARNKVDLEYITARTIQLTKIANAVKYKGKWYDTFRYKRYNPK